MLKLTLVFTDPPLPYIIFKIKDFFVKFIFEKLTVRSKDI